MVRDPAKRGTLELFIDDAWINESYDHSPIVKDISIKTDEDDQIIKLIEAKFHVDRETVLKSMRENIYDDISALYYLIYNEKETRGRIEADILNSPSIADRIFEQQKNIKAPLMSRIEEDGTVVGSVENNSNVPQLRPAPAVAKPGRRRFTVGNDSEVTKFGEEDEDTPKQLSKMQKEPSAIPGQVQDSQQREVTKDPPTRPSSTIGTSNSKVTHSTSKTASPTTTVHTEEGSPTEKVDASEKRKRHNTIVGILRNTIYRPTDGPVISPSSDRGGDIVGVNNTQASYTSVTEESAFEPIRPGEEGKPRSLRFTFNSNTTSSKPADELIKEVIATCAKLGINHKLGSRYLVECQWFGGKENSEEGVKFEVELCKLPRLKNLHGLRFKRMAGSSNDYKEVCEKLVATLQL